MDLKQDLRHIRRLKNDNLSNHPLRGPEVRIQHKLQRKSRSPNVFITERGGPADGFHSPENGGPARRAGRAIGFLLHPHMLRNACGFELANDGQDTRVRCSITWAQNQRTVRYAKLDTNWFKGFWKG